MTWVHAAAGRRQEAQSLIDESLARPAVRSGEESTQSLTWLLEAAAVLRDREATALLMGQLAPAAPTLLAGPSEAPTCVARQLGDAAMLLGDREGSHRYYQQALEICQRARFRPEIALARLGLAELALDPALTPALSQREREQDEAEAHGHLDFAIAEFREMKMQPSLERALALKSRSLR